MVIAFHSISSWIWSAFDVFKWNSALPLFVLAASILIAHVQLECLAEAIVHAKSFKVSGISMASDGSKDGVIHCLKLWEVDH